MASTPRKLGFETVELGPTLSMRRQYRAVFDTQRREYKKSHSPICSICDAVFDDWQHIHGHEVHVPMPPDCIRLERIDFICIRCHDTIHYDRTRAYADKPYLAELQQHYCQINGVTQDDFDHDFAASREAAKAVSASVSRDANGRYRRPSMNFGPYEDAVRQYLARVPDDDNFEFLPDHEAPWDTAMWRETFGNADEPDLATLGTRIENHPEMDEALIEMAAAAGAPWRDLRDMVIYADGRCLIPEIEQRRLEAARRGYEQFGEHHG